MKRKRGSSLYLSLICESNFHISVKLANQQLNFRTETLKTCCIVTILIQGWIYVKNIFGRKEKYFLMSILVVQLVLWITVFVFAKLKSNDIANYNTGYLQMVEYLFVPVVLVYLLIRSCWKKDKTMGNSQKCQLFRFVYLLVEFFVYIIPFSVMILVRFH